MIVNPVIEPLDDELVEINEGCLSVPDLRGERRRATSASACATSTATAPRTTRSRRGLTAGTFQHEVDHLDGVLFLDRVATRRTFTTWEQFERCHRDAFVERIAAFVERVGS